MQVEVSLNWAMNRAVCLLIWLGLNREFPPTSITEGSPTEERHTYTSQHTKWVGHTTKDSSHMYRLCQRLSPIKALVMSYCTYRQLIGFCDHGISLVRCWNRIRVTLQTLAGTYFAFLYQHVLAVCGEIGWKKVRAMENMRTLDRSYKHLWKGKSRSFVLIPPYSQRARNIRPFACCRRGRRSMGRCWTGTHLTAIG